MSPSVMSGPAFSLGQKVKLVLSSEAGVVIGHAVYLEDTPSFYVRYLAGDGCQRNGWFNVEALDANDS